MDRSIYLILKTETLVISTSQADFGLSLFDIARPVTSSQTQEREFEHGVVHVTCNTIMQTRKIVAFEKGVSEMLSAYSDLTTHLILSILKVCSSLIP